MCSDIGNHEIAIANYTVTRLDRNRHGGGVAFYVKSSLYSEFLLAGPPGPGLEFVLFSVGSNNFSYKTHVGIFYRPPSSTIDIFDSLQTCLHNANICSFSNFVLLGDFNVNFNNPLHPLYSHLCSILDNFSLVQVVSESTHTSPVGTPSLIDLAMISNPSMLSACSVIPPVGSSDHNGIQLPLKWRSSNTARTKPRKIWRYNQADYDLANSVLTDTDWEHILQQSNDINGVWKTWKDTFMSVMQ